jgi:hypothetical protein
MFFLASTKAKALILYHCMYCICRIGEILTRRTFSIQYNIKHSILQFHIRNFTLTQLRYQKRDAFEQWFPVNLFEIEFA